MDKHSIVAARRLVSTRTRLQVDVVAEHHKRYRRHLAATDTKEAIHRRMEEVQKDEHPGSISKRVALRNALTTLADLQRIAYARKPNGSVRREVKLYVVKMEIVREAKRH